MAERDEGFTILEVLIALVVCTSAAVALLQGLQVGIRGAGAAASEAQAMALARQLLARAGIEESFKSGTAEGVSADGQAWRVTTLANTKSGSGGDAERGLPSYWVQVEVEFRDRPGQVRKSIRLSTLKIGETSVGVSR